MVPLTPHSSAWKQFIRWNQSQSFGWRNSWVTLWLSCLILIIFAVIFYFIYFCHQEHRLGSIHLGRQQSSTLNVLCYSHDVMTGRHQILELFDGESVKKQDHSIRMKDDIDTRILAEDYIIVKYSSLKTFICLCCWLVAVHHGLLVVCCLFFRQWCSRNFHFGVTSLLTKLHLI